tara:strand:- start:156 stop:4433 length:4278 start_codon:yes stop_codon:yes gene_type:complete
MSINAPKETILEDANTKIPGHLPSNANNISIAKQPKQPTTQTQTDESVPVEDVSRETPVEDPEKKEKKTELVKELENLRFDVVNGNISQQEFNDRSMAISIKKDAFKAIYESGMTDLFKGVTNVVVSANPDFKSLITEEVPVSTATEDAPYSESENSANRNKAMAEYFKRMRDSESSDGSWLSIPEVMKYATDPLGAHLDSEGILPGTAEYVEAREKEYFKSDAFFKQTYDFVNKPVTESVGISPKKALEYILENDRRVESMFSTLPIPGSPNLPISAKKNLLTAFKGMFDTVEQFTSPKALAALYPFAKLAKAVPTIANGFGLAMSADFVFHGGKNVKKGIDLALEGKSDEASETLGKAFTNTTLGMLGVTATGKNLVKKGLEISKDLGVISNLKLWKESGYLKKLQVKLETGAIGDFTKIEKARMALVDKGLTAKQKSERLAAQTDLNTAFRNLYTEFLDFSKSKNTKPTKSSFTQYMSTQLDAAIASGKVDPKGKAQIMRSIVSNFDIFKGQAQSAQAIIQGDKKNIKTPDLKPNYSGNINLDLFPPEQAGVWRAVGNNIQSWRNLRSKGKWSAVDANASKKDVIKRATDIISKYQKNNGYVKNPEKFDQPNQHEYRAIEHIASTIMNEITKNPKLAKNPRYAETLTNIFEVLTSVKAESGATMNIMKMKIDRDMSKQFKNIVGQTDEFEWMLGQLKQGKWESSWSDKFIEYQRNMRLAALSSVVRSSLGNLSNVLINITEAPVSSAIERTILEFIADYKGVDVKTLKRERRLNSQLEAFNALIGEYIKPQKKGETHVLKNFKSMLNEDVSKMLKDPFYRRERFSPEGEIGKGWDFVVNSFSKIGLNVDAGKTIRIPQRIQAALDVFFRQPAETAFLRRAASNAAQNNGLNPGTQRYNAFIKRFLKNPTDKELKIAKESSEYLTYQQELGRIGQWINKMRTGDGKLSQIFIPFFNTPANLYKSAYERIPVAGLITPSAYKAFNKGYKTGNWGDFSDKVSRNVTLPALSYLLYQITGMGAEGKIKYQGNFRDLTASEIAFKEAQGHLPNSVEFYNDDGTWTSVSTIGYEPLNTILKSYTLLYEGVSSDEIDWSKVGDAAKDIVIDFNENPVLSGVADVMDLVQDKNNVAAFAMKFVRGLTIPNAYAQMHSIFDPVRVWNQGKSNEDLGVSGVWNRSAREKHQEALRLFEKEFVAWSKTDERYAEAYKKATADYNKLDEDYKKYSAPSQFLDKYLDEDANYPQVTLFGKPRAKPNPLGGIVAMRVTKGGTNPEDTFMYDELERLGYSNMNFKKRIYKDIELTRKQQYLMEAFKGELFHKTLKAFMLTDSWTKQENKEWVKNKQGKWEHVSMGWSPIDSDNLTEHQTALIDMARKLVNDTANMVFFQEEEDFLLGNKIKTPGGGIVPKRSEVVKKTTEAFRKYQK